MLAVLALPLAQATANASTSANGTLEICKAKANGMSGRPFQFSVNGGALITVNGGACSGPLSVPSGNNTIVESATNPATDVSAIVVQPRNRLISSNLSGRTVTVNVKSGSTPATETLVRFYNEPAGGTIGQLKVCKSATDPILVGVGFSFTQNGGPAFSVPAGTVASPNCSETTDYAVGTLVNVQELATPGAQVTGISVSDGRGSNFNIPAGSVTATIGPGVTIVTYTNSPPPPPGNGYIEVCKEADGPFVSGTFSFTITAPGYSRTEPVLVGQCTAPLLVPAGNVTVTEAAKAPYSVSSIVVNPADRLVSSNLANRTVTVTVPVSQSSADETLVTFFNRANTGQVKVCKTLAANSAALANRTFTFNGWCGHHLRRCWCCGDDRLPHLLGGTADRQPRLDHRAGPAEHPAHRRECFAGEQRCR
jgi:hypothetical protein